MKLSYSETAHICKGLSLLMSGGISLAEGADLLAEGESGAVGEVLSRIGKELAEGYPLSAAMEKAEGLPGHVCSMVRIGEETGKLEQTLASLAVYYEENYRTTRKIKNALAYPCIIAVLLLVVIAVLLMEVLPVFDGVYASLGSRLTGVAAVFLHAGRILKGALPVILAGVGILLLTACLFYKNTRIRAKMTEWYQNRFGDRGIARKFNNAHFARALAMGMSSGLPLEDAMELSRRLLSDVPGAAERCGQCAQKMNEGESLVDAMCAAELLSPAQSRLFAAGMYSGNGDEVLAEIADRVQQEASDALENVVSKVEPSIVLVVSLLVGLILLSVMMPLMSIMSTIG